jgi:hypothetical protein
MEQPPASILFIAQLHQLNGMLKLGVIPNPGTNKRSRPEPDKARFELQLLEVLREKTAGNLDAEEQEVLDEMIDALGKAIATLEAR